MLALVCLGGCWLTDWNFDSQPTRISGTVVNAITGKPVPGADVFFREMNGSRPATQAESQGRFTAVTEHGDVNPYFLYASGPAVGKLLGMTFYTPVPARRRGERHYGIVLPSGPATEISGRVYGTDSTSLSGCEVAASNKDPDRELGGAVTTDKKGAFSFTYLGADRFFLAAECQQPWLTAKLTEPIVILPGERRQGLTLHLVSVPRYSIRGKVVFSSGDTPRTGGIYFYGVSVEPLPPLAGLDGYAVWSPRCHGNAYSGAFQCDYLPAGTYKLRFALEGSDRAEVEVKVKDQQAAQPELTVQLKKWDRKPFRNTQPPAAETGYLHLRFACADELKAGLVRI